MRNTWKEEQPEKHSHCGFRAVRVFLLWCCCLFFLPQAVYAAEQRGGHIYDRAELLSDVEENRLEELCQNAEEQGIHILLLTEGNTQGKTSEEYADDFYDSIYPEEEDENGAAVLVNMEAREIWISTAGIMRYCLTDREIDQILDHLSLLLKQEEYAAALERAADDISQAAEEGISSGTYLVDENGKIQKIRRITLLEGLIAAAAGAVVFCLVYFGVRCSYKKKGDSGTLAYARTRDLKLEQRRDFLVDRHVSVRRLPKDPPPGEGSGRSTVHTSSSGRSHGGGGRSF